MLSEGQQLSHYRLVRLLKSGGMGEVYLAEDMILRRQVAIKVIHTDTIRYAETDEAKEAVRLFIREAQAVAQLDQFYILPVYDSGEEYIDGTALMYMVMPYRSEGSLKDWLHRHLKQRDLLPLQTVERIVHQASLALQHAHDRGIIHQDVKPSNFLVIGEAKTPDQLNLQLADFGVAKFMMRTSESQVVRGTPTYMAPEQWEGRPVFATDQYALAVMAYELLSGRPPYVGSSYYNMWHQHFHVEPVPPSRIIPNLPILLDGVILRGLAKPPEERFSSVSAFANAFQQALRNIGDIHNGANSPLDETVKNAAPVPIIHRYDAGGFEPPRPSPTRPRSKVGVILIIALTLILIVGSLGFYFSSSYHNPPTQVTPTATHVSATITTATTSPSNYPAYFRGAKGTLAFDDQLNGNNQDILNWDLGKGTCQFNGGVLQATKIGNDSTPQSPQFSDCYEQVHSYNNFAYEVTMTFVTGNSYDCGGVIFRVDPGNLYNFYYYYICQNKTYGLATYSESSHTHLLKFVKNSSIKAGAGQSNLIAVVAQGANFDLYVNQHYLNTVPDTTYSTGNIGVLVRTSGTGTTEVTFADARVWSL